MLKIAKKRKEIIKAIIAKDKGETIESVTTRFGLTPNQYFRGITALEDLVSHGPIGQTELREIYESEERVKKLYLMTDEFIIAAYLKLSEGELAKFYDGTFNHPHNIELVVYHALDIKLGLHSSSREEIISKLNSLPNAFQEYLKDIHLGGVMAQLKDSVHSPMAILHIFDKVYIEKTGDKSLFDLSEKFHLHPWGGNYDAPRNYWKDELNRQEAVYHTLNEQMKSLTREGIVQFFKELNDTGDYFTKLGLGGLMTYSYLKENKKNSVLYVVQLYDLAYQRHTGNESLFKTEVRIKRKFT